MGYPDFEAMRAEGAAFARGAEAAGLTFQIVQRVNTARALRWHPAGLDSWSPLEWAGALCGEAGEAANVAKKLVRLRDGLVGNKSADQPDHLRAMLADEIADVVLYAFCLAAAQGIDLEQAVIRKFNIVSERNGFPERL